MNFVELFNFPKLSESLLKYNGKLGGQFQSKNYCITEFCHRTRYPMLLWLQSSVATSIQDLLLRHRNARNVKGRQPGFNNLRPAASISAECNIGRYIQNVEYRREQTLKSVGIFHFCIASRSLFCILYFVGKCKG